MLIALAVLAALEAAAPPAAVQLTRSGAPGGNVNAAPRTLSDVAREMREGRRAVGGFSAVETTVSGGAYVMPAFTWDEEETRREPEVVPEPRPPESAVPFVSGYGSWYGGMGGTPRRRPPHVRPHARPSSHPGPHPGAGPSPRGGGVPRSAARSSGVGTWTMPPRR